jgi:4-hydroxybenzoate polyprenyltransferase
MKQLTNLWRLMRPRQWVKSTFVFTGILFANAWRQPQLRLDVLLTAIAFSLTASGVYIINDLLDKESDLNHPSKQHRPLTAGAVSIAAAVSLMLLLEIGSLVLGFFVSGRSWEFYRSICF